MNLSRLSISLALLAASGCATDAGATVSPQVAASAAATSLGLTMVIEATVGGDQLAPSADAAYYFVLATGGGERPLMNGAAPLSHPYPDPRGYLPFVRDESFVLDREPVAVPATTWSHFWALVEEGGQPVVWQGRRNPDGSVEERARRLTRGSEWDLVGGKTWKLIVPVSRLDAGSPLATGWSANLATARRAPGGAIIDRWGQVPNQMVAIAPRLGEQPFYDTNPGPTFPAAVPAGADAASLDWRSLTVRLVDLGAP